MRILVVRPQAEAEETAARLAELGHQAIVAPVLSIRSGTLPPPAGPFEAILVTSRNAVPPLSTWQNVFGTAQILAVGPRTGEDLRAQGLEPAAMAGGDGISLAELVKARLPAGARVLHAAGRDRRPEPAGILTSAGYRLIVWEAYAAEAATRLPQRAREALASGGLDAIMHYSPRSAALLRRLAEEAGLGAAFATLTHFCLSANVAASLGEVARIAIAHEPSEPALFDLLGPNHGPIDAGSRSARNKC